MLSFKSNFLKIPDKKTKYCFYALAAKKTGCQYQFGIVCFQPLSVTSSSQQQQQLSHCDDLNNSDHNPLLSFVQWGKNHSIKIHRKSVDDDDLIGKKINVSGIVKARAVVIRRIRKPRSAVLMPALCFLL